MIAGTLEVQMLANMVKLTQDMAKAKTVVTDSMKGIESAVNSAKSVLQTLGLGLGIREIVNMVTEIIDLSDHLNDLSKTTKIAVEDLAGLRVAAKQSGADLDSIAQSINKLSVNMGKDAEKFARLGVTAKDPIKAFQQFADVFAGLEDQSTRAAVAALALGKSWSGAAPLLSEGGAKIGEMVKRGQELSGITKQNAEQADVFNDKMTELSTVAGRAKNVFVGNLVPSLTEVANAITEAADKSGNLAAAWVALGGAAAIILGQTDAQKFKAHLQEVNNQLALARKQLEAGTTTGGADLGFFGFLVPDITLSDEALKKLRETIVSLEAEKRRLGAEPFRLSPKDEAQNQRELNRAKSLSGPEAAAQEFLKGKLDEEQIAAADAKIKFDIVSNQLEKENQLNENAFKQGRVAIEDYYNNRREIVDRKLAAEVQSIASQIATQRKIEKDPEKDAAARTAAHIKIMELIAQGQKAQTNASIANEIAFTEEELAVRAFYKTYYQGIVDTAKAEQDAREKADEAFAERNQAYSQEAKDEEFQRSLIGLEVKALAELGPMYGDLTNRTLEYHIQRETLNKIRQIDNDELREEIRLNGLNLNEIDLATEKEKLYQQTRERRTQAVDDVRRAQTAQAELNEARRLADAQMSIQVDMWQGIDRAAHDTWDSIFDSGKSMFDRLKDSVKNGLASLLYSMTIRPLLINIATTVGGGDVARAAFGATATTGGGIGGSISNILSTGKSAYEALTGKSTLANLLGVGGSGVEAASLLGGAGAIGSTLGGLSIGSTAAGIGGAFGTAGFGAAVGGGAEAASLLGGGALAAGGEGAAAAFGTAGFGAAAGAGTTALAALSAAAPYIGLAIAAASALGVFGGSKKAPAVGTGYTFQGNYAPGSGVGGLDVLQNYTAGGRSGFDVSPDYATKQQVPLFNAAIDPVFEEFTKIAKTLSLDTSTIGSTSFSLTTPGIGQAQDDAAKAAVAAQLLSKWAEQLLPNIKDLAKDGEETIATFARLADEMVLTDKLVEIMGMNSTKAFGGVGAASIVMRDKLVDLMGGLSQAQSLTTAYYENFYTQSERHAADLDMVNKAMREIGVTTIPVTRMEFRKLVEAQDLSTDKGKEMFASLMKLAPAFSAVTDAIEETAAAANSLAQQITDAQAAALQAVNDQITASRAAEQAASQAAENYRGIVKSIHEAIASIRGVTTASAGANLNSTFGTAMTGNAAALADMPKAAQDFLEASLRTSTSASAYARDQAHVLTMLAKSEIVAQSQVDWNEYQATLLKAQTGVLEQIKATLELPDPNYDLLSDQVDMLTTIAGLLSGQTAEIVTGYGMQAVLIRDQTGTIVAANALTQVQTGAIAVGNSWLQNLNTGVRIASAATTLPVTDPQNQDLIRLTADEAGRISLTADILEGIQLLNRDQLNQLFGTAVTTEQIQSLTDTQTRQIISGNAVADAIRNIGALNNSYTQEMLRALVSGDTLQNSGISQTVTLLQRLVDLANQQAAEAEAARLAREKQIAIDNATAAFSAQKSISDATLANLRNYVATTGGGEMIQQLENLATGQPFDYSGFHWTPGVNEDVIAQERQMLQDYLTEFYKALNLYNAIPQHAGGGMASGWSMVGEHGPELIDFTSPGRVYTAAQTRDALSSENSITEELQAMREENAELLTQLRSALMNISSHVARTDRTLDRITDGGVSMRVSTDADAPLNVTTP